MRYPKSICTGDIIGITALSDGIVDQYDLKRLDNAILKLEQEGFRILETKNVRHSEKGRSSSAVERARQLEDLIKNKEVSSIICAAGGDFLLEMLTHFDFSTIDESPKWIQGYSDPTSILFTITTKLDIATIYGNNVKAFGMEPWHLSIKENVDMLRGNLLKQHNFDMYEGTSEKYVTGLESYNLDTPVVWKNLYQPDESIYMKGRIIGGCLDVLVEICGTSFDYVKEFINRYQNDGIIWYFDNCELTSERVIRAIWKLNDSGWFLNTKGIIFGRSMTNESSYDITFNEAIRESLSDLEVPVIWDADIGHIAPRMTVINGAIAEVSYQDGKGDINYSFE